MSGRRWRAASACSGLPRSCRRIPPARMRDARSWRSTFAARASGTEFPRATAFPFCKHALSNLAMLRKIYDWCIAEAGKPHATWIMGFVSFVESSFFPVPPDAMLIPMAIARPDRAYYFATVCTVTSVAGGVLGWVIGYYLYDTLG